MIIDANNMNNRYPFTVVASHLAEITETSSLSDEMRAIWLAEQMEGLKQPGLFEAYQQVGGICGSSIRLL
ncbi:MAG: hypothetical protein VSS75_018630 [Candidatus Parabeggiatoa sp.]|nr:hypothetical protein [Candidatus Parabeggiatoa sp.]